MAEETLNARLMAAMSEMGNPVKGTPGYNYKYETLADVLGIVKPALSAHGLAFRQGSEFDERTGSFVLVTAVFDGGETMELDRRPLRDDPNAQTVGSWETYMRRYALKTVFGLCGEDDDGQVTAPPEARPSALDRARAAAAEYKRGGGDPQALTSWARANIRDCDPKDFTEQEAERFALYCEQLASDIGEVAR